jgi:hypothetical protein
MMACGLVLVAVTVSKCVDVDQVGFGAFSVSVGATVRDVVAFTPSGTIGPPYDAIKFTAVAARTLCCPGP